MMQIWQMVSPSYPPLTVAKRLPQPRPHILTPSVKGARSSGAPATIPSRLVPSYCVTTAVSESVAVTRGMACTTWLMSSRAHLWTGDGGSVISSSPVAVNGKDQFSPRDLDEGGTEPEQQNRPKCHSCEVLPAAERFALLFRTSKEMYVSAS